MANVVISSEDALCKSLAKWLIDHKGFSSDASISELHDGGELVVIAHDVELGDGSGLISELSSYDYPMDAEFKVILIVCSAADMSFGTDLVTPAERIANALQRNVYASTTIVYGAWDPSGLNLTGNFMLVEPNTDLTSMFARLSL